MSRLLPPTAIDMLFSTDTIRQRCGNILNAVLADRSPHWRVELARIDPCAMQVAALTRARFPDLQIPYHSRWRHFEVGGIDRFAVLRRDMAQLSSAQRARSEIDLTVVSVLLDAGAGAPWRYAEPAAAATATNANASTTATANATQTCSRSEGLALASWHMFQAGAFSSVAAQPWQADAAALAAMTPGTIERGFQVTASNPLVGVAGRALLLNRLAAAMLAQPQRFGSPARPGGLYDRLTAAESRSSIGADELLHELLISLAPIWPSQNQLDGQALGDCWPHPLAGGSGVTQGWVPLHKLSQWLAYSLIEPFERAGVRVTGLDKLTALAEYRNGGLLIDAGVIAPRDPGLLSTLLRPSDEPIIEWRALTVALIDRLADAVRRELSVDAARLPLARILEGGTWACGRELAQQRRNGLPPLNIVSDGTVF